MACGCLPVAGALESVQEWVTDGVNGLLCDPRRPDSIAAGIVRALDDHDLRRAAAEHNVALVAERAEYRACMRAAERFYADLVGA